MTASRFTIFMLLEALPSWLSLDRTARGKIAEEALGSGLSGFKVTHRHYDAEAFSGRCSDISVFETDDLTAYYYVIERLRDSAFFAVPYFRVIDIIPTIAEGYRDFESHEASHAA